MGAAELFWSAEFWLPPGVEWSNFTSSYGKPMDLLYPIPIALGMMLLRIVVEKVIFKQIGLGLSVPSLRHPKPGHNQDLETTYQGGAKLSRTELAALSTKTGMSSFQVTIIRHSVCVFL